MTAALFYLQWHSLRNRLLGRLKRLRQPKYLAGAVVGGLYIYFYFFRFLFQGAGRRHMAGWLAAPENALLLELGGALVLFVIVLLAWIFPTDRAALNFTEAEVAFLFPAPVSRRQLIHYKLIRTQLAILFSAFFLALVSNRFGGNAFCHALGWWLILSILGLHFIASSFARTLLLNHGLSNGWRRGLTLAALAALVAFVWHWARVALPPLTAADTADARAVMNYAQRLLTAGPALYLLYPFRLVVRPFLAPDTAAFAAALVPALLIYLFHYLWVVNSGVAFEEASLLASQKTAVRRATLRAGNWQALNQRTRAGRPWFRLAPTGPAPVALLWKNLFGVGQVFNRRLVLSLVSIAVVFCVMFANAGHRQASSLMAVMGMGIALGYSLLLGPQILRLDFRADLPQADLLKTWPLRGWQIALGEILAPVVVLAGFQWLLLLVAAGLVWFLSFHPAGLCLAIALGAAMLLPVLDALLLIIPNTAAVLFPAWFQTGKDSSRGLEVMGQRMIFGLAQMLAMLLALVPAAVVFALIFWVTKIAVNPVLAILPATFAATLVVAAEVVLGVMLLGKCFDRFDVAGDSAT